MQDRLTHWFDAIAGSSRGAVLALGVISLLCFVPGFFTLPAIDRDEARYAQASRQMIETGDYVDIRLQGQPRHKQPAGIYWLQTAFARTMGSDGVAPIWVHRLPSLVGATAAVLLTYWIALPLVGGAAAFLAGAIMAVSLILGVEARLAKTDAVLLATILLAQSVLVRAFLHWKQSGAHAFVGRQAWLYPLLFWTALAAGTMVKGPLNLLFVGLTVAALAASERSASFLKPLRPSIGVVWFLSLALPWYVAIALRTDGTFFSAAMDQSVAGKITQSHEGHGAPPLTHLAYFWATFWPGSLLFALAIPQIWRRRREDWLRFLYCWAVPAWIAFELFVTKLPHYLLPVFPAIAIALSGVLTSQPVLVDGRVARFIVRSIFLLSALAAFAAVVGAEWFAGEKHWSPRLIVAAALSILAIGVSLRYAFAAIEAQSYKVLLAGLLVGMIASYWLFYPAVARIRSLWPSQQAAGIVASYERCETPFLVSAGYGEPSLVFNTRTDIVLTDGAGAAASLAGRDCALALVEHWERAPFLRQAREERIALTEIGRISGYNIGAGQFIDLSVFAPKPASGG